MVRKLEEYGIQVDRVNRGFTGLNSVIISPAEELNLRTRQNRRFSIEVYRDYHIYIQNKRIMFSGSNNGCAVHYDWECFKIKAGEKISAKISDFERKWNSCFKTKMSIDQIVDFCFDLYLSYSKES